MKIRLVSTCLVFGTLLGTACTGGNSATGSPNPVIFIRDSPITLAVKAKFAAAHMTGVAHIDVNTDKDGVVWLSGSARTQEAADRAAAIARETNHVKAVYNDLKIRKDV